jgi:hypothetical protein
MIRLQLIAIAITDQCEFRDFDISSVIDEGAQDRSLSPPPGASLEHAEFIGLRYGTTHSLGVPEAVRGEFGHTGGSLL